MSSSVGVNSLKLSNSYMGTMQFIVPCFVTFMLMSLKIKLRQEKRKNMQCLNKVHLQDQRQRNNKQQDNRSLSWQFLLLSSSCEFNFLTESFHKLFELDFTPFSTVAHCHMICFLAVWDNGSVHPHVPSSHIYNIFDTHLT